MQTNSDRDIFDLRRKLDKIDISYQEKIEKLQSSHDREKGDFTDIQNTLSKHYASDISTSCFHWDITGSRMIGLGFITVITCSWHLAVFSLILKHVLYLNIRQDTKNIHRYL